MVMAKNEGYNNELSTIEREWMSRKSFRYLNKDINERARMTDVANHRVKEREKRGEVGKVQLYEGIKMMPVNAVKGTYEELLCSLSCMEL